MAGIEVRRFEELPWAENPAGGNTTDDQLERARAAGYRRKPLLAGEGDVHLTHVEMGPGMRVEPHSHSAVEAIHVVAGSLTPDGEAPLAVGDSIVVPAGGVYGFTVGDEGVSFLIFRPSEASITHVS
jgi:quercetin dioxygenase-like cupin family protein